jgi:hypothetical protein
LIEKIGNTKLIKRIGYGHGARIESYALEI